MIHFLHFSSLFFIVLFFFLFSFFFFLFSFSFFFFFFLFSFFSFSFFRFFFFFLLFFFLFFFCFALSLTSHPLTAFRQTSHSPPPLPQTALPQTALRRTAQNFILSSLFWGSSRAMWVVFEDQGPQYVHVGFTRQPENSKRAHFRAPALQTPPKFHERTPQERGKKERKLWREREKKARNYGLPTLQGPHPSGPPFAWV